MTLTVWRYINSIIIIITVSHGSAYTVVRATQQVNGKWQFWRCLLLEASDHNEINFNSLKCNLGLYVTMYTVQHLPKFWAIKYRVVFMKHGVY